LEPLVPPQNQADLTNEIRELPPEQLLENNGELSVYIAHANQIPKLLKEIGRLREETFRQVGEGTGKSIDLDEFDHYYIHLFVWNQSMSHLVCAYRMGPTDDILKKYGKAGLYTYTLFNYKNQLLRELGPALELSRSFVRQSYQKNYAPLLLLWRGIGRWISLHPQYKILFGAVSITNDYSSYSRQLMAAFLKNNRFVTDLSRWIRPRNPYRQWHIPELAKKKATLWPGDIEELSSWVSGIESDSEGIPDTLKTIFEAGRNASGIQCGSEFQQCTRWSDDG
jgi:hypothetical protein